MSKIEVTTLPQGPRTVKVKGVLHDPDGIFYLKHDLIRALVALGIPEQVADEQVEDLGWLRPDQVEIEVEVSGGGVTSTTIGKPKIIIPDK